MASDTKVTGFCSLCCGVPSDMGDMLLVDNFKMTECRRGEKGRSVINEAECPCPHVENRRAP
jgi:hypothetical protein